MTSTSGAGNLLVGRSIFYEGWSLTGLVWGHKDVLFEVKYADLLSSLEDEESMRFCPLFNEIWELLRKD